ncbi:MAG: OmpA family protein [Myxococcota bacterium]
MTIATLSLTACAKQKAPPAPPSAAPRPAEAIDVQGDSRPRTADATEDVLSGDLAAANEHAYRTGLLGDVYFEFDSASLHADARERLSKNVEFLRAHPEFVVRIEGHCDERGTNDYNLALGGRRSEAAKDYAVSLGIGAARLRTVSCGEEQPACADAHESCWRRNRRARFVLIDRVGSP